MNREPDTQERGRSIEDSLRHDAEDPPLAPAEGSAEQHFRWHRIFVGQSGLRAGWGIVLFLAMALAILSVSGSMLLTPAMIERSKAAPGRPASFSTLLLNDGLPLLAVGLATWIMAGIERRPVGRYGFGGDRRLARFLAGFGWGALLLSVLVLTLHWAGLLVFDARLLSGGAVWTKGVRWILGFLLVGLFEEAAMRGYLQFTLARGLTAVFATVFGSRHGGIFGFWTAALLLSFLFGASHGNNPGESPIGLVSAGLIGVIFCLSLWRTGSLWWALGFHTAWDWAQSFVFGVADSGTMVEGHLLATHPAGRVLLSGGTTGPEGSLFVLPMLVVIAVIVVWTLPKQQAAEEGSH